MQNQHMLIFIHFVLFVQRICKKLCIATHVKPNCTNLYQSETHNNKEANAGNCYDCSLLLAVLCYGTGLNSDKWHNVTVSIDVHGARLIAKVDSKQAETPILGLHPSTSYGISTDLPSVVLIGGEM